MSYQSDTEQFNGRESETATLLWKLQEVKKMHRLSQVLISTGLIGLLAVPGMTKTPTQAEELSQVMPFNPAGAQDTERIEQRNKEIVQQYFDDWRNKRGSFFDLLAPEATWTITGTGATAGTYRKQELLDQVINPTNARLSTPIVPTVRGIWADGDMVIALWDGEATARDGKPYRNTYTWYFRMKDGKAIEAIAFLDMQKFTDLWTRVPPRN